MKTLITGASGMLGGYLTPLFIEVGEVKTLGRSESNDFRCDLTREIPRFGTWIPDLVVHCAGSNDNSNCFGLNLEGTRRLLSGLENNLPKHIIFISSHEVYSRDAGLNIDEECVTWATSDVGRSKAQAESELEKWCASHGIMLTIVRPTSMFGNGISGWGAELFNDVLKGRYLHIRGNELKFSLVTAYDAAHAIFRLRSYPGVFNISDGEESSLIALAEAMSANAEQNKRMTHLPLNWAKWINRFFHFIPTVGYTLDRALSAAQTPDRTISNARLVEKTGMSFHPTLSVIARQNPDYPYSEI